MEKHDLQTIGTLLTVYTDIDLLALELCAERIAQAPTLEAKLELAHQVEEERIHFRIQEKWLETIGMPFSSPIDPDNRKLVQEIFSRMDWFDFLSCLQLGIEGIGIALVEKVASRADEGTRASLEIPIRDEKRQTSFGLEELQRILAEASPAEKERLTERLLGNLNNMYTMAESFLPIDFEGHWMRLGLSREEMWETVHQKTLEMFRKLGLSPVLPEAFSCA
ncbi:hypothetical protein LptCag_0867 [Leptospirillum ferriphilum]|uniref:Ferritin-like domain-containing protein n=1 Tax=Leptospirillum ferriphilum TaxID=178606 RepID=A0A094WBK2_9BACT|nr:ferritin-like fold-containing protein [Leptospirillum ferriphilum]KGA93007.1 hypothetical protein LptCag_0867 [Leptospirillum ferriphilum]